MRVPLLALPLALLLGGCPSETASPGEPRDASTSPADAGAADAAASAGDDAAQGADAQAMPADAGLPGADAGEPGPDASASGPDAWTPFGGACDPAFPGVSTGTWNHPVKSAAIVLEGSPNHRVRDQVVNPGEAASLRGHFTYGVFDADLPDEDVEIWLRTCPDWELLATITTDADGVLWAAMPTDLPKGEYLVRMMLKGDGTTADGVLAIWPAGTQALVTDLDGTMTTDDWQAYQDVIGLGSADMYPDANTAMNLWAQKGYRILYLTARPQLINRYSRTWLGEQGFPGGPLLLSEDGTPWDATDDEKVAFKGGRLIEIAGKGVSWKAAYGNATTDIDAYENAGIPKADTYIIGENGGVDGTQAIPTVGYADHLATIGGYPDAVQP